MHASEMLVHMRCLTAAAALMLVALSAEAGECGTRSPSLQGGEPPYADIPVTVFRGQKLNDLEAYLADLRGTWRGDGELLDCDGDGRWHESELEIHFDGRLRDVYRVKKEVRDREARITRNEHYRLRLDGPHIELNLESPIELLRLSRGMLMFRGKYVFSSGPGTAVAREVIYAYQLDGDRLIYEERVYTLGRLTRHNSWALKRIF